MGSKINFAKIAIKRGILIFLIFGTTFLLIFHLRSFIEFLLEMIMLGIPIWLAFGYVMPRVIAMIVRDRSNDSGSGFFLLESSSDINASSRSKRGYKLFFKALDFTITPLMFMFGILNIILNHISFLLDYDIFIVIFMLILSLGFGFLFPTIYILRDSNLVIIDSREKVMQPIGKALDSTMRRFSGLTAFLGFLYTLYNQSFDVSATISVLMAITTVTYPPLLVILLFYTYKHSAFVRKINQLFSKKFKKCRVIIEIGNVKNSAIQMVNVQEMR